MSQFKTTIYIDYEQLQTIVKNHFEKMGYLIDGNVNFYKHDINDWQYKITAEFDTYIKEQD